MGSTLEEAAIKRVMNKKAVIFGSYGWSGGAVKRITKIVEPVKWDIVDVISFQGGPTDEDLQTAVECGKWFAELIAG
jgi:flavorubredoxin